MKHYKVLIVDDEQLARQRLEKLLEDHEAFTVVGEAENGLQAMARIEELKPDIVLLDIRMPGADGLAVADSLKHKIEGAGCAVIFTTAYDEHALEAFDLQACGYLLKPVNREKLASALGQAARLVDGISHDEPVFDRTHLSATSRGKVELIPLENVRVLQADHKYVTVFHTEGESILDESLKALEEEFDPLFRRVHRNALVAGDHVKGLEKNDDGQYMVVIEDVDVMPVVSRRLVTSVRNWMKQL